MQFRQQGNRIQVLAYRGYNKEKKRAEVKLLGSFGRYNYDMSDGLMSALTDSEKSELQSHITTLRQEHDKSMRHIYVRTIASSIKSVSDSLSDEECASLITAESASATYEAIDLLTKKLRKLGFRRPARVGFTDVEP